MRALTIFDCLLADLWINRHVELFLLSDLLI